MDSENSGVPVTMLVGPTAAGANNVGYPYPVYMGGGQGGGSGMGNGWGDGAWIILLIIVLLAAGGGWGGNNGGGFMGNGNSGDFPWLMNGQQVISNNVSDGFRDAQLQSSVTSVRDGISNLSTQLCGCCGDISTQLCNGFSGVNATVNSGVNTIAQQLYAGTIADLERSFAAQTASTQGMTAIQSQLAQYGCDNRLATESLRATVLSENCADRYEAANNTRDIITALTSGIQSIKDEICADRLEGYKRENDQLRTQLNMANLAASQIAQTSQIVDQTYNRLSTCPVGTVPVYGETPIFRCNNNGCGCGCNGNGF